MASLNLQAATSDVRLNDPNLVGFGALDGTPTSTSWSYLTPAGHRVSVTGTGMTYDAAGRPIAGTATSISIDLGADGVADVLIGGISVAAATLDDGPASFWRLLEGNDLIRGPEGYTPYTEAFIVGDGVTARPGDGFGGLDIIHVGKVSAYVSGDVEDVGSPVAGSPPSHYRGGNDEILGHVTEEGQGVVGDASRVYGGSRLTGGNDTILLQSSNVTTHVSGDAGDAVGEVVGGDDHITVGWDYRGEIAGDVAEAHPPSRVEGGDDTIYGGGLGDWIAGDVYFLRGGRLIGGDDTIDGGGGNDVIAGDAYEVRPDSIVTGGDDLIRAGGGNDEVYGDAGYGPTGPIGIGGNDRIYGDSGNDRLHGDGGADTIDGGTQSDTIYGGDGDDWLAGGADNDRIYGDAGNDLLDGGAGADVLVGLTGDDTYFVNDPGDIVSELAGFGTDTVWTTLGTATLWANVEILRFNGVGNFAAIGNGLDNSIAGSAGNDRLEGGDGNDVLEGGAGADALLGDSGIDTASYVTAGGGVRVALTGSPDAQTGDAQGDTFSGVENLTGSTFADLMVGDELANTLSGGAGNDSASGGGGNDVLIGDEGTDVLNGDAGNDVLRGGRGADYLFGGLGADVFDFDAPAHSAPAARDILRGGVGVAAFEGVGVAGGDRIDLSGIDANARAAGDQAFAFGGTEIGRVSLVDAGGNTLVRCNTDRDAAFELELVIEDGGTLAAAYRDVDFIL